MTTRREITVKPSIPRRTAPDPEPAKVEKTASAAPEPEADPDDTTWLGRAWARPSAGLGSNHPTGYPDGQWSWFEWLVRGL